ncbi:hypothetical protein Gotri_008407 [Gossypium trilobum]|uniref:EF-hand domain-containing protein n=7 Tax=Gossypium TaxID=3633 RepID=A0A7J9C725_GOSGO|nr:hypothetical protein [Gossypium davidsonii]MBA0656763.1 hypothetical protein [Gossypium klotzschianum]MBA0744124.1 hypothetical protein [Gossypium gossypioides]MBA0773107.1 hypothetical protein [Gossypium trilobum]MBA0834857.1 hypothetical protein [Gossypium armourianum]TYG90814.1 hypothetical protein ES288_A12G212500v1 [Gossypium darwinii]
MEPLGEDDLSQLKEIFARFDMDSDGSLTILELAALLRSIGIKPSGDQIHVLLANMDANGNGSVEFDELASILPELTGEILNNQERLTEVFQLFDRDGNGYITAAELAGCMAKMGYPLTYSELTEIIKEADSDGDGVISFTEFSSIMGKSALEFLGKLLRLKGHMKPLLVTPYLHSVKVYVIFSCLAEFDEDDYIHIDSCKY